MDVLLIGYGAIAREVMRRIAPDEPAKIRWLLVRSSAPKDNGGPEVIRSLDELRGTPALAIEAAGHAGVVQHGAAILERGIDLAVISIGALADQRLYDTLADAARAGKSKLLLPAGAIGGADALAAARTGGLDRVVYTSRKPPRAWKGTPGEKVANLDALKAPATLYQGNAREAATLYPQNANVAATIALAGIGFEKTQVKLVADPTADGNIHHIAAAGGFGSFTVEMRGKPLPENPKSSTLAALSLVRAIKNRASCIEI